ncbi:lytic murein transglycosylase B [Noviherbaspirillum pedocola]|uniref:Lytic murein transglycosylase B n=1 Tax=Noviherbaspirillum pedocola TaxID=2801341 RepID=A0A934SYU3_9BURK|nr:lytic murein transglycosylase B [Noviherbaspirillum pedocola]MBK4738108.1 lytic murein transglycosylase B [Noviherbaspirillum pedocola]
MKPFRILSVTLLLSSLLAGCQTEAVESRKRAQAEKPAKPAKAAHAAKKAPADTDEFVNFNDWSDVQSFIDGMVERYGFSREELQRTLGKVRYVDSAVRLMRPAPPGRPKNWTAYRARFVEPVRIDAGVAFWNRYADALARAEEQYGVPAEIIVGILGVETIYGRNTGDFRVMDAITTLAFAYPDTPTRQTRMAYFREELANTLLLARDAGIDPFSLRGSYAGAVGWPQFMPGSIRKFGVDFDGDGRIDLRNSPVDAIGSIANFLVMHGWRRGEPLVFPASVDAAAGSGWELFLNQGLEAKFRLNEMRAAGVKPETTAPDDLLYGLVDLQNGEAPTEYWLGANNFFAITQYNRSFFYAMSVIDLGRAVRVARGI